MRILLGALAATVGLVALLNLNGGAQTLSDVPPATNGAVTPVVAELFTSQSCSSCPPAERLFADLAEREDLIVLEWHVDYWDRLVHGRAGAWKDPYSDAAYTKRQRDYNRALRGTGGVYTPQAVINGASEAVGSHGDKVGALLHPAPHAMTEISITSGGDSLNVDIADYVRALDRPADILKVTLLPAQTTSVPRGENRGVTLTSKNVVLSAEKIGAYSGTGQSFSIARPAPNERCAILIQEQVGQQLGPIIGAGYCS